MLADRRRARRAASPRNGQPITNSTSVATTSAATRQPVTAISAGRTMVTSANSAAGATATTRRPQARWDSPRRLGWSAAGLLASRAPLRGGRRSGGHLVALILDHGHQLRPVDAGLVGLDGHGAAVDVDPRRADARQRHQRALDRALAVITVDPGNRDGHRRHRVITSAQIGLPGQLLSSRSIASVGSMRSASSSTSRSSPRTWPSTRPAAPQPILALGVPDHASSRAISPLIARYPRRV